MTGTFPFITFPPLSLSPFDEIVAGLIPSTPAVWLLVLAVPSFIRARTVKNPLEDITTRRSLSTFLSMIMVSVLAQFLFLTSYFFTAMRFLADFYLPLALGIWILVWKADASIQHRRSLRALFWIVIIVLVLWTTGIGFFGSFDVPPQILCISEPIFYTQVASDWNHWYAGILSMLKTLGPL